MEEEQPYTFDRLIEEWFRPWSSDSITPQAAVPDDPQDRQEIINVLSLVVEAALSDLPRAFPLQFDFTAESVRQLDDLISLELREYLMARSDRRSFTNAFLVMLCEVGAYIGQTLVLNPGGHWVPRRPFWDSSVQCGHIEGSPFQWVIKAFSDDIDDAALWSRYSALTGFLKMAS